MNLSPVLTQSLVDGKTHYTFHVENSSLGMIIFNHVEFHEIYNRFEQNFEIEQVLYFVTEPPKAFSLVVICPKGNQVLFPHSSSATFSSSPRIFKGLVPAQMWKLGESSGRNKLRGHCCK